MKAALVRVIEVQELVRLFTWDGRHGAHRSRMGGHFDSQTNPNVCYPHIVSLDNAFTPVEATLSFFSGPDKTRSSVC